MATNSPNPLFQCHKQLPGNDSRVIAHSLNQGRSINFFDIALALVLAASSASFCSSSCAQEGQPR